MIYQAVEYNPRFWPDRDDHLTIRGIPGWFAKLFDPRHRFYQFKGGGTVWHHFPTGERAGTLWESLICDLVEAEKNKRLMEDRP